MSGPVRTAQVNVVGDSSSAQTAVKKVAEESESAGGRINKAFSGVLGMLNQNDLLGPLGSSLEQVSETFDQINEKAKTFSDKMMMFGAGGVAIGGLLAAAAGPDQQASAGLQQAIDNVGQSYADFKDDIEKTNASMAQFGHNAADSMTALTNLTTGTGSAQTALDDMQVTANLAAAQHESLASAATQVVKIIEGSGTKTLKEYGITVASATAATKALTTAQNNASKDDAAVASAKQKLIDFETILSGKKKITAADLIHERNLQDAVTAAEAKDVTGKQALQTAQQNATTATSAQSDALGQLSDKLQGRASAAVSGFMGQLKVFGVEAENQAATIGQKYAPAIMGLSAGIGIMGGMLSAGRAAMEAFKESTALTAIEVYALEAAEIAQNVALGVMVGLEMLADTLGLPLIATVGLIVVAIVALGVAIYELATHWSQVWGGIEDAAAHAWNWIRDGWNGLVSFFEGIPGALATIGYDIARALVDPIIGGINLLIDGWDAMNFTIPGFSLGPISFGGFTLGLPQIPNIPYLANGGIVTSPTLAMIGEQGPEAVVPLSRGGAGGLGGDLAITVPVQIDGRTFAVQTAHYTRNELLRMGRGLTNLGLS